MVNRVAKRALITGINGQDGSYLAEFLLNKGYEVWGLIRRHSVAEAQTQRLNECGIFNNSSLHLKYGDVTDMISVMNIVSECLPHEVYHLAAQSHVRISFDVPKFTTESIVIGTLNILEAVKLITPTAKVYLAGSSEMFGNEIDYDGYQRETTPMRPVSPYGCSKTYAFNLGKVYRDSYGLRIWNGILFNHESPRRGENFVTNKIVKGAVKINSGYADTLALGNLEATRDWGHSKDYTEAMWLMLQTETPDDFVCATGKSHSIRDLCDYVFSELGMDYTQYVVTDPKYYRPNELNDLRGDASNLICSTGWSPQYTFQSMLKEMIKFAKSEIQYL